MVIRGARLIARVLFDGARRARSACSVRMHINAGY